MIDQPIFDSYSEPMVTQDLQLSASDWRFLDPRDPFTISLRFPNALDPDKPSAKLSNTSLEVFGNQTVPNLYLRIASITGVFPQNIRLRILDNVLCHRGVILSDRCTGADGIVLGKCPTVTKDRVVVVMMLCEEGLTIPQGLNGYPVGFPASLPPDGATRFYLGDAQLNEDMIERYEDKYHAVVASVSPVLDRRFKVAQFNAQERYNRRLWIMDMKAVWDYQHQAADIPDSPSAMALNDVKMQQHLEYASYLDYMNDKMTLYDEDYRSRARVLKNALTDHDSISTLTAQDRSRIDAESRLRQSRTQALWKGLARMRDLRAQTVLRPHLSSATCQPTSFPYCQSHSFRTNEEIPELDIASLSADLPIIEERLPVLYFSSRKILLTTKTIRRVLNFKENIMKYGVFVPRNDHEADSSPEAVRWDSGRQLEWLRLRDQGTFERNLGLGTRHEEIS
jgi:hypothetical protein